MGRVGGLPLYVALGVFSVVAVMPGPARPVSGTTSGDVPLPVEAAPAASAASRPARPSPAAAGEAARAEQAAPVAPAPAPARTGCPGGGATDQGVTATTVRVLATTTRTGAPVTRSSGEVGLRAAVDRVNRTGGVCGRRIELVVRDDEGRAGTLLRHAHSGEFFALTVVPGSAAFAEAAPVLRIPAVGTPGTDRREFAARNVWPVAPATASMVRSMVRDAYDRGSRTFGIVHDARSAHGKEAVAAFRHYVRSLPGASVVVEQPLDDGRPSYVAEAKRFNDACGADGCDFVTMAVPPTAANTYVKSQPEVDGRKQGFGRVATGATWPLFGDSFARGCGRDCDSLEIWTGFRPPLGRFSDDAAVAEYVEDVRERHPTIEVLDPQLQSSYAGIRLLAEAMRRTGADLTRDRLRAVMDDATFPTGLAEPLDWTGGHRCGNLHSRPFRIVTAAGSYAGLVEAGRAVRDPLPCAFPEG